MLAKNGFKSVREWFIVISTHLVPLSAYAANIGQVAGNAVEPVGLASSFFAKVCLVLSIGFIIAGILKFVERRRNPDILPSTPFWLLLFGILMGLLVIVQYNAPSNQH